MFKSGEIIVKETKLELNFEEANNNGSSSTKSTTETIFIPTKTTQYYKIITETYVIFSRRW